MDEVELKEANVSADSESSCVPKRFSVASAIKTFFSPQKMKKTIMILVSVIIVLGSVIGLFVYNNASNVAKRYVKAFIFDDYSTECKLTGWDQHLSTLTGYDYESDEEEEFFEEMSEEYEEDISSWRTYSKVINTQEKEYFEDCYGKFKLNMDVTKNRKISAKTLRNELFNRIYLIDTDEIKGGKEITVKMKIIGVEETEKYTFKVYLTKINGFWKVMAYDWIF